MSNLRIVKRFDSEILEYEMIIYRVNGIVETQIWKGFAFDKGDLMDSFVNDELLSPKEFGDFSSLQSVWASIAA